PVRLRKPGRRHRAGGQRAAVVPGDDGLLGSLLRAWRSERERPVRMAQVRRDDRSEPRARPDPVDGDLLEEDAVRLLGFTRTVTARIAVDDALQPKTASSFGRAVEQTRSS